MQDMRRRAQHGHSLWIISAKMIYIMNRYIEPNRLYSTDIIFYFLISFFILIVNAFRRGLHVRNSVCCCIIMYPLLLLFLSLWPLARSQSAYLNCTSDTRYPLRFVGFFPCLQYENFSSGAASNCNSLPLTAVEYAITLVNQDVDLLRCFRIELFPITVTDPQQVSNR